MQRIAIIPAYEPPNAFIEYAALVVSTVDHLIVVNDGSGSRFDSVFAEIAKLDRTDVLSYPENHGKGYALKTALSYCAEHFSDEDILVTADCDGQHAIEDVLAVCEAAQSHPETCVLGCRDFSQENVPARSRAGNTNMLRLLRLMYGIRISDSQTGLRAFTVSTAQQFLQVNGDRFEYETGMLIYAKRNHISLYEVPIRTIYPENGENHISHFETFRDSVRVVGTLLRHLAGNTVKKPIKTHIYGHYGRFVRWLFRTFSRKYRCDFIMPEEPAVFVCRHLDMHGPYTTMKWLPTELHPMIIHMYFDRKATVKHMSEYTFAARYGKRVRKFNLPAHVMSWIAPPLMKSLQAVPVYRDGLKSMTTIKQGVRHLLKNESLIVYPDIHYMDKYDKPSEIYEGFLYIGELYYKKTGKRLPFVPLLIDDKNRRITAGQPIFVTNYRQESASAAKQLQAQINWYEITACV